MDCIRGMLSDQVFEARHCNRAGITDYCPAISNVYNASSDHQQILSKAGNGAYHFCGCFKLFGATFILNKSSDP